MDLLLLGIYISISLYLHGSCSYIGLSSKIPEVDLLFGSAQGSGYEVGMSKARCVHRIPRADSDGCYDFHSGGQYLNEYIYICLTYVYIYTYMYIMCIYIYAYMYMNTYPMNRQIDG